MKRVLITGKNSYIGTSVEKWLLREPDKYSVNTIDVRDDSWKEHDFSQYDVLFHVAGIAHIKETKQNRELYFRINRDLTNEIAIKAKESGVDQFIFMSSMAVYGQEGKLNKRIVLNLNTPTNPKTYYGISKLEAEVEIKKLSDHNFKVMILRPPMIYGRNCPGNFALLEKIAKKTVVFPYIENQRSMLHIDKLCYLLEKYIQIELEGIILLQDDEYANTSKIVEKIAKENGKRIFLSKSLGLLIRIFGVKSKIINKAFGSLVYEREEICNNGIS